MFAGGHKNYSYATEFTGGKCSFRPKVTEIEWNWENVVYHTAVWPFMEEKQP